VRVVLNHCDSVSKSHAGLASQVQLMRQGLPQGYFTKVQLLRQSRAPSARVGMQWYCQPTVLVRTPKQQRSESLSEQHQSAGSPSQWRKNH